MPNLDTAAFQTELEAKQRTVEKRIGGAANIAAWKDLTADERNTVEALAKEYLAWRQVLTQGMDFITKFIALGPDMPTMDVPQSMIGDLDREFEEAEETRTLFRGVLPASDLKQNPFSDPPVADT